MATETEVTRTDDSSGDLFRTFDDAVGRKVQAVALDPEIQGDVLSWYATAGAAEENANDLASGAGMLFSVSVVLLDTVATDRYLHIFDALTPTGVPVLRALIPAGGQAALDLGVYGRAFSTGITLAVSTTLVTYTSPAANESIPAA